MPVDCVALTKKYFDAWNAHDVGAIQALHAPTSTLADWDASHGPTNEAVAKGIGGIWEAVPAIKIEIVDVYTVRVDHRISSPDILTPLVCSTHCLSSGGADGRQV